MEHYVVGFLFDYDSPMVLLLRKTHPSWQAGKLNGIGGHIEEGESPIEAMEREFFEEAGLKINRWKHFATLECPEKYRCIFYSAKLRRDEPEPCSKTEEKIEWVDSLDLPSDVIDNLKWLIPLSKDYQVDRPVEIFTS